MPTAWLPELNAGPWRGGQAPFMLVVRGNTGIGNG